MDPLYQERLRDHPGQMHPKGLDSIKCGPAATPNTATSQPSTPVSTPTTQSQRSPYELPATKTSQLLTASTPQQHSPSYINPILPPPLHSPAQYHPTPEDSCQTCHKPYTRKLGGVRCSSCDKWTHYTKTVFWYNTTPQNTR